ncbi:MAG: putative metalloprotease CJM1_0395 family protein [Desulfosarcinaceae bacterium]|nr:putative metalloprotease CJM1_0395 family protein [Desulfosarcinaceae bacterium]
MIAERPEIRGPEAPHGIHPVGGREDAHREAQERPSRSPSPTGTLPLPEDRVSLGERSNDPNELPAVGPRIGPSPQMPAAPADVTPPLGAPQGQEDGAATSDSQKAAQVRDLKQRDAEVKAHEQAHLAAGGGLVQGAASYTYEKGPDGAMYAVGGEVKIDTAPARTPEQTIRKAQQIRRAALAPAQPSATDRAVAAAAAQMEAQAKAEKTREAAEGEEPQRTEAATSARDTTEADRFTVEEDAPTRPFTAPAIHAYQRTATAQPAPRTLSTFV